MQLGSDQSVNGFDSSRLQSDSYVDEAATDDCASCSSGVFRDNDDCQPSVPSSETNNNTKKHVSGGTSL